MEIGDIIYVDWVESGGIMNVGEVATVTALVGQRHGDEFTAVVERTNVEISCWWDDDINGYKGFYVHPSLRDM